MQAEHAVSADANTVFFTSAEEAQLYVRLDAAQGDASTHLVSTSQRTPEDPNGPQPAIFWGATKSGSEAFFSSCEKLTQDSTAHSLEPGTCEGLQSGEGQDLYSYDVGSEALHDLTVDGSDPEGADVQAVLGISDDGTYIYFVANGDLDGSGPGTLGDCQRHGQTNYTGACSIYVWHDGSIHFVSRIDANSDYPNWWPNGRQGKPTSEVSRDGTALLFRSYESLTGYQNESAERTSQAGEIVPEFYRYEARTGGLVCVTCNPTGARPVGEPYLHSVIVTSEGFKITASPRVRNISSDGDKVFFESADRLVPQDTNGLSGCASRSPDGEAQLFNTGIILPCQDVYEWEAEGSGSCPMARSGGCLYLMSSGQGSEPSYFADASAMGDDVFFLQPRQSCSGRWRPAHRRLRRPSGRRHALPACFGPTSLRIELRHVPGSEHRSDRG